MGIFGNIKKGTKDFIRREQEKARDQREFDRQVADAVKKKRREAYLKEAERQAMLRAKIDAQRKFNPKKSQQSFGLNIPQSLIDPVGFTSGNYSQKVANKILKNRKKKKKSRSSTAPKKDAFHDLIWNS
jgi:hypothetical protein